MKDPKFLGEIGYDEQGRMCQAIDPGGPYPSLRWRIVADSAFHCEYIEQSVMRLRPVYVPGSGDIVARHTAGMMEAKKEADVKREQYDKMTGAGEQKQPVGADHPAYKKGYRDGRIALFEDLNLLAGYFQDGSAQWFAITSDDATRTWRVKAGGREYGWGRSIEEAIENAVATMRSESSTPRT